MIVIVKWKIRESETSRILALLPELAEKTRGEPGNVSYAIYQSESSPRELILHEEYVDAAAADAHRQSEHYERIVLNEIIPHLEVREVTVVRKLV
jgi:quinol monooxygenase YgiN